MSLWERVTATRSAAGELIARDARVSLADIARRSLFGDRLEALRGRTVILAMQQQLAAAVALLELDGVARRIIVCPPDVSIDHMPGIVRTATADTWIRDGVSVMPARGSTPEVLTAGDAPEQPVDGRRSSLQTEWVLLTSGTAGEPKLVLHTLDSLTFFIVRLPAPSRRAIWATFYDIRRYGGMQVFLRAVLNGSSLVLSSAAEPVEEFLSRAADAGVTHISGTPSHWRRALMSGAASRISPEYVRLSGEIADQAILDSLRAIYPLARVGHAFASTEAGLAFEVEDGLAGFPATFVGRNSFGIDIDVSGGTLRIRSPGNAVRYLGEEARTLKAADGFVDTGDRLELREGRYYFMGRVGGVINVGGLKIHPEEVEAVINGCPWVRMSRVRARRSPITGAIVTAEIVLADQAPGKPVRPSEDDLRHRITETCRYALPPHKVPATIRFVPSLQVSGSGKLIR